MNNNSNSGGGPTRAQLFEPQRPAIIAFLGMAALISFSFLSNAGLQQVPGPDGVVPNAASSSAGGAGGNVNNNGITTAGRRETRTQYIFGNGNGNGGNGNGGNGGGVAVAPAAGTRAGGGLKGVPQLTVGVPVLPLDESGMWAAPAGVKRLWLDVGAHESAMYTLPLLSEQSDVAAFAFEPMYDKWGRLSTTRRGSMDRLYTFPAAVGLRDGGYATFRRAGTDMCSSLNEVDPAADKRDWPGGCTSTAFANAVPVITLEEVLSRVPKGIDVEFLKVDAQGGDFDVIRSAGEEIRRVGRVLAELQVRKALYAGSGSREAFVDHMEARGFTLASDSPQNKEQTEINLYFVNTAKGLDPRMEIIPEEPRRGGWSGDFSKKLGSPRELPAKNAAA